MAVQPARFIGVQQLNSCSEFDSFLHNNSESVIYFYNGTVLPSVSPLFEQFAEKREESGIAFGEADIKKLSESQSLQKWNIDKTPLFIAFHKGEEASRYQGADARELRQFIGEWQQGIDRKGEEKQQHGQQWRQKKDEFREGDIEGNRDEGKPHDWDHQGIEGQQQQRQQQGSNNQFRHQQPFTEGKYGDVQSQLAQRHDLANQQQRQHDDRGESWSDKFDLQGQQQGGQGYRDDEGKLQGKQFDQQQERGEWQQGIEQQQGGQFTEGKYGDVQSRLAQRHEHADRVHKGEEAKWSHQQGGQQQEQQEGGQHQQFTEGKYGDVQSQLAQRHDLANQQQQQHDDRGESWSDKFDLQGKKEEGQKGSSQRQQGGQQQESSHQQLFEGGEGLPQQKKGEEEVGSTQELSQQIGAKRPASIAEFDQLLQESNQLIAYFYRDTVLSSVAPVFEKYAGRHTSQGITFAEIDIAKVDGIEGKWHINETPMFIAFSDGKEEKRCRCTDPLCLQEFLQGWGGRETLPSSTQRRKL